MRILFIPAKIKAELNKTKIEALKLPKNIAIAYSIQYIDIANKIRNILSKRYNITQTTQILGCSKPIFSKNTEAVLLIGSGQFHAVSLAITTNLPIYILDSDKLRKVSEEEINDFKKKQQGAYLRFLDSNRVGILVSAKPGQENLKRAINIRTKLKDKKTYLFISNEIDVKQFENFKIDAWVNTTCPRLDFEGFVFNMDNLGEIK